MTELRGEQVSTGTQHAERTIVSQKAARAHRKTVERSGGSDRETMMIDTGKKIAQCRERVEEGMSRIEDECTDIEHQPPRGNASLQTAETGLAFEQQQIGRAVTRKPCCGNHSGDSTSKDCNCS